MRGRGASEGRSERQGGGEGGQGKEGATQRERAEGARVARPCRPASAQAEGGIDVLFFIFLLLIFN